MSKVSTRREIEANGQALAVRLLEECALTDLGVTGLIVRAFAHGQAAAFNQARGRQTCRVCGCTNHAACPGRCWWVDENLCSSCSSASVTAQTPKEA